MSITAVIVIIAVVALFVVGSSLRQVQQYEKGVVLRFGRLLPTIRQPGLRLIVPIADRMSKVSTQTIVLDVPSQARSPATTSPSPWTPLSTSRSSTRSRP